jgi:hypothetical protein
LFFLDAPFPCPCCAGQLQRIEEGRLSLGRRQKVSQIAMKMEIAGAMG